MDIEVFVDLNDDILKFINYEKSHIESFDEIKNLLFTSEKLQKDYQIIEIFNLIILYQKVKATAIAKILNKMSLTFMEGFLIERLLMNFNNSEYISVDEHLKKINEQFNFSNK